MRTADLCLALEAMFWLAVARAATLTIPFRWTSWLFALRPEEGDGGGGNATKRSEELTRRIGWALRAASARSPWRSTCLAQALAGRMMLRRRRLPVTVAMGVARSASDECALEAHAWLCCGGAIVTGAAGHEKFHVVARFN